MMSARRWGCVCGVLFVILFVQASVVSGQHVVLVTGFEPFGSYTTNPSQLIAESLNGTVIEDAVIIGIVLPVNFTQSVEQATDAIQRYQPDLVVSLGLNVRAQEIRVEKIGINLKRYPKNDGTWSFPRRIDRSGPFLRCSPFPARDIVKKIQAANISAKISCFAGTYICNSLLYQLLGDETWQNGTKIGFIHVPLLDTQDPEGMPLGSMLDAVRIAVQVNMQ